jgi:hypothetical protein
MSLEHSVIERRSRISSSVSIVAFPPFVTVVDLFCRRTVYPKYASSLQKSERNGLMNIYWRMGGQWGHCTACQLA